MNPLPFSPQTAAFEAALPGRALPPDPLPACGSLADLLQRAARRPAAWPALQRQLWWPVLVAAALGAAWAAWAPLHGAVVAPGQVQPMLGRKTVQHQEGGIVMALLVKPGQRVRQGEPLLQVGDVRGEAALSLLQRQAQAERLRLARASAELAMASTFASTFAPVLDSTAGAATPAADDEARRREQALFDARRDALLQQLGGLATQQREAQARVAALQAQQTSVRRSNHLADEELGAQRSLVEAGFVSRNRLLAAERGVADALGRDQALQAQIAEAQLQSASIGQAIAQARSAYQQHAADELKEADARLRDILDRLRPTQDQVERQTVRAPVDGTVMALRVNAVGAAVAPREPLLEIAPDGERLVVALRIAPQDIGHVHLGGAAEVRLVNSDQRRQPLLAAEVSALAPDTSGPASTGGAPGPGADRPIDAAATGYLAQVSLTPAALAALAPGALKAGMAAEVFITTPPRSLLRYLLQPLGLFTQRALREP